MALKQINELTALTTPTEGYNVPLQKTTGVVAEKLDLKLLSSYDTGAGFAGCYTQRVKIGEWRMKNAKWTMTLTDPTSIIAIEPGVIISDDSKQYPFHSIYDSYFYENLLNIASGIISTSGNTSSVSAGTTDTANEGGTASSTGNKRKPMLQATVGETQGVFPYYPFGSTAFNAGISGDYVRINHPYGYVLLYARVCVCL